MENPTCQACCQSAKNTTEPQDAVIRNTVSSVKSFRKDGAKELNAGGVKMKR